MLERNGQICHPTVGYYFNTPLLVIDRANKQKFSEDMGALNLTINKLCKFSHLYVYPYVNTSLF